MNETFLSLPKKVMSVLSETFSKLFNEFFHSTYYSKKREQINSRRSTTGRKRSFIKLIPIGAARKVFWGRKGRKARQKKQREAKASGGIFLLKHLKLVLSHTFEGLYHLERLQHIPHKNVKTRPKKYVAFLYAFRNYNIVVHRNDMRPF